ncbi:MAG TPA: hypothetical protein PLL78_04920 [Fimbriimonadaceae bacterium]|nr:hypothetical protein [Fimbriimonadaceae bacterium]HRJ96006.1 hypothetical protein [Fimbriimonadaceae bacterium]
MSSVFLRGLLFPGALGLVFWQVGAEVGVEKMLILMMEQPLLLFAPFIVLFIRRFPEDVPVRAEAPTKRELEPPARVPLLSKNRSPRLGE